MCSSCHAHVLADAMLKDSTAACPSCRVDLARQLCSHKLAVEKAVAELLTRCLACDQELPRHEVIEHQRRHCCERYVSSCRVLTIDTIVSIIKLVGVRIDTIINYSPYRRSGGTKVLRYRV